VSYYIISFYFSSYLKTNRVSLKGSRKLQMGTLGGSSSVIGMSNSNAYVPTVTGLATTIDITMSVVIDGDGYSSAFINGPTGSASGSTVAGGTGSGTNNIGPTTMPGPSSVVGKIDFNTQSNFAGTVSPGLVQDFAPLPSSGLMFAPAQGFAPVPPSAGFTGGGADSTGTVTVSSIGTGTGPSALNSVNSANIFSGGQVVATNVFGSAGGLGSGATSAASFATGTTAADPLAIVTGTGIATGNFNNAGAGAFTVPSSAVPPTNVLGATGNNAVFNSLGATPSYGFVGGGVPPRNSLGVTTSYGSAPQQSNILGGIGGITYGGGTQGFGGGGTQQGFGTAGFNNASPSPFNGYSGYRFFGP
jgi:hypothetical protein